MGHRDGPCSIDGCDKQAFGRGWCSMHYARWRTYGDPLHETRRYEAQPEACSVEDCERDAHGLGLCKRHYQLHQRHGDTTDPRSRRFWAQVDKRSPNGCWEWVGYVMPNGYGSFGMKGTRLAHRIAYQYLVGPIPEGLVIDHLCRNRACVNPAHLEPVTPRENIARGDGGDSWGYVPEPVVPMRRPKPATCTESGCDRPVYKRTICRTHYRAWLKDPAVPRPRQMSTEERFWSKVTKTPTCWLWSASINPLYGYGQFHPIRGTNVGAHRYAYELVHGPVPDGFDVHHECMNRRCVNPDHLRAVSRSENLRLRLNRRT